MPVYIQNLYEWLTGLFANNPPLEEMVLSVYQQAVIAVQDWSSSNLIPHLQSIGSFESLEKILEEFPTVCSPSSTWQKIS